MDEEQKFWGRIVLAIVIVLTLTIGSCNMHIDYRIAKAIEQGTDPVLARAAFSTNDGSYERIIHIAKKNLKGEK